MHRDQIRPPDDVCMEMIKEYVHLLVRRKEEFLAYQKVHNDWKLLGTDAAKEIAAGKRSILDDTEKETLRVYALLKEHGLVSGGDSPWGTELIRYASWVEENLASRQN